MVNQFYEFGPFRIDPVDRLLLRQGEVIPLTPKAVETLLALVENSGHVLEKDDLMKRVWPDTFVEEGGLARNISLLRKALGDGLEDGRYIETIPRRGYRFVAEVKEVQEEEEESRDPAVRIPIHPPAPPRRLRRKAWIVAVLAVALIAALIYVFRPFEVSRRGAASAGVRSLAVLPLKNLSSDPAQDYFADGMTEELINYLAKIESLRVISRTSAMVYRGAPKPLPQIARELKVDAVVEGSVLLTGKRVRITAQLIEAKTEKPLWAESYESDLRDVLALQSEVAGAIARQIQVKLTGREKADLAGSRPVNPEAYQAYLRGRYLWNRRTTDWLNRAIDSFQQAIEKDPSYALAHTGLADSYALLGSVGYDAMPPREAMTLAKAAAQKALAIDDKLGEAHASLAYIKLSYDWDWPEAEKEFQRAIQLNPGYATAHHWYAHYLMAMGRLAEAETELKRAQELDPLSEAINLGVGWRFYYARQYDQAIEQFRKTLAMYPESALGHCLLGLAIQNKKLYKEAIEEFQTAAKLSDGMLPTIMLLGHAYGVSGRRQEALRQVEKLRELSGQKYVPALYTGFIYAGMDDKDRAFQWLEKACDERSEYLVYLKAEPGLDGLRADPRFPRLLRRLGL